MTRKTIFTAVILFSVAPVPHFGASIAYGQCFLNVAVAESNQVRPAKDENCAADFELPPTAIAARMQSTNVGPRAFSIMESSR